MSKYRLFCLLLLFIFVQFSCHKPEEPADSEIVINELLPVNNSIASDEYGDFDDWVELYNLSSASIDISGYFLSDNEAHPSKWQIPDGTSIPGKGFLVIWADDDSLQTGLHTNFKLSSLGETILLSEPDGRLIDKVIYPGQDLELSYSRNPDGTGTFRWQAPTFESSNNIPK